MRYLTLILLLWSSLNAQNREALLIGNSKYQFISNLNDTSINLSSLKSALKGLDFNVIIKNDLNSKKLKQAIDKFKERLARSHETIGFLYYSGHGCQLDNVGYLVPTNVNTKKKLDIKYDAMNIDKMLETLDSAGNRVNMLFLDACRDVPTNAKGSTKGLGQAPQRPKGTLLVYATEAGKTAEDNSKFINALISNINKPNKNIRDIAYDISNEVADQTGEGQIPEVFAKRLPEVVLKRGGGNVVPSLKKPTLKPQSTVKPVSIVQTDIVKTAILKSVGIEKIGNLMYQNQPFTKQDKQNYDNLRSSGRVLIWSEAEKYCQNLVLDKYKDWRLPNRKELKRITSKKININHESSKYRIKKEFIENLPDINGKYNYVPFWSSEEADSIRAFHLDTQEGYIIPSNKTSHHYVLCIRGK